MHLAKMAKIPKVWIDLRWVFVSGIPPFAVQCKVLHVHNIHPVTP